MRNLRCKAQNCSGVSRCAAAYGFMLMLVVALFLASVYSLVRWLIFSGGCVRCALRPCLYASILHAVRGWRSRLDAMCLQIWPILLQHRCDEFQKLAVSRVNGTTCRRDWMELTIVPPRLRRPSQGSNITRFHSRFSVVASCGDTRRR